MQRAFPAVRHFELLFASTILLMMLAFCVPLQAQAPENTSSGQLTIGDYFKLGRVSEPRLSPDGNWIAYTVTRANLEKDKSFSRIWMVPVSGGEAIALTAADESSSHPRWSPDGQYLAFLSARNDGKAQLWTLFRKGGEAVQLTATAQPVKTFEWSPDSHRVVLLLQDATARELAAKEAAKEGRKDDRRKTAPAWVIDRQQFKTDYVGYLDRHRTHLYVLDVVAGRAAGEPVQLTSGDYDDSEPVWSPDGRLLAFTSNRSAKPDRNYNTDIWVVSSDPQAAPAPLTQVTHGAGTDDSPAWSPDGNFITHTTVTDVASMLYATSNLAITSASGGDTRVLTSALDRMIFRPAFALDGHYIWFLLEDNGEQNLARIDVANSAIERVVTGRNTVSDFALGRHDQVAVLVSNPGLPAEVFTLQSNRSKHTLVQTTFTNQEVLKPLSLGEVVKVQFDSKDGTKIGGFIIKPVDFVKGKRYPTVLDIHGGPQSQYDFRFNYKAQLYAANGYLVVHPNPRGSTGYGQAFCKAIWLDWGGPDFEDVMAAVDDAIERGWADADRLGVGGWSYGGILTDHVITKTDRFKAAISGASEVLYVVNYGHDMYQRWWEREFGLPWEPEARARYEKISPFNRVAEVVTPTLIMGGQEDWNVPIINSEQLYLALHRLGVETQLIVYPGEHHGIDVPSHVQDLYQRFLGWFDDHL